MTIHIQIENMKDAERFSAILRKYPEDVTLSADRYCVDPKSILGVLAIMYSAHGNMALDTGSMPEERAARLKADVAPYLREEEK